MEELTENDYEILDACCELQSIKIKALKEENAVLQSYKDVNEDFKTAWKELKAENERLKEEIKEVKKYQYEQEYLDKEIEEMQKALKTLAEGLNKRQILLQEIKKIAERQLLVTNVRTYQMVYYADFSEYRNEILQKITKEEEE